jgi:hypothetical protein
MFAQPQDEHRWLEQMVGEWTYQSEALMDPNQPPKLSEGRVSVRSLKVWIVAEMSGGSPEMGPWTSQITLGYDPEQKQYVGTFVGSMMTYIWYYAGQRAGGGNRLVLETEGPRWDGSGRTKYEDIIEVVDADHWILSSRMLQDNGEWFPFMTQHHYRVKA